MQYSEYIMNDNARREREIQLANQYNQKPEGQRVENLWMIGVKKHRTSRLDFKELAWTIGGLLFVGIILILSIWL